MIDSKGFRFNVGMILCNQEGELLWARRTGQDIWQFPQGGIAENETPDQAMYRELQEELGLECNHVSIVAKTRDWLSYRIPKYLIRKNREPRCIGQKQIWFLLKFTGSESDVRLDYTSTPEFDSWRWVDFWSPLKEVVSFKRKVYKQALSQFEPLLFHKQTPLASVTVHKVNPG